MRVALAGDSHLTEASPRRSVTKLAPRLRQAGLDVHTVAVGGADSRALLEQRLPGDADWVICSIGVNDAAPWKQVPIEEFTANCDHWLASCTARCLMLGAGPVVERGDPATRTNAVIAQYCRALELLAHVHAVRFVALPDVIGPDDLADDGVHLADSGYTRLAARVLAELVV